MLIVESPFVRETYATVAAGVHASVAVDGSLPQMITPSIVYQISARLAIGVKRKEPSRFLGWLLLVAILAMP